MRILIIVPEWPSNFRPNAMPWLYSQIQALANYHEIVVLVLESVSHYLQRKYWRVLAREGRLPVYKQTSPQVKLLPVWHVSLPRLLLYRQVTFRLLLIAFWHALKYVDLKSLDVIHAHFSSPAGALARILSKRLQIPYIVTEHASNFDHLLRTGINVKRVICDADRVLCVSPLLAEKIRSRITLEQDNLQVVPNGVNLSLFQIAERPRQKLVVPRLLFVGYLVQHKGLHILLEAVSILRVKGLRCTLQVVGDGSEKERFKRKAADMGICSDVDFVGAVANDEIVLYYQRTDILVLPSLQESFGVVVIEALACGIPVIATRCGGPETIIDDRFGRLIEPGNVTQLAKAIQEMSDEYHSFDPFYLRNYVLSTYALPMVTKIISRIYNEINRYYQ